MNNERIHQEFESYLEENDTFCNETDFFNEITSTLFNDEMNFINCDRTSNQRVYTTEPELMIVIKEQWKVWSWDKQRCENCGAKLDEETDIKTYRNSVPYGDTYVDENIIDGYECSNCGYDVEW